MFAPQVAAAVEARDAEFFLSIAATSVVVCPNAFVARCEGQPAGTEIEGIWFGGWRSQGTLLTPDEMAATLTGYLDSLADPTVHAIGHRDGAGLVAEFSFFAVIASAEQPEESTYVFEFVPSDAAWRLASVMEAAVLAEEWLSGESSEWYDYWERWEGAP